MDLILLSRCYSVSQIYSSLFKFAAQEQSFNVSLVALFGPTPAEIVPNSLWFPRGGISTRCSAVAVIRSKSIYTSIHDHFWSANLQITLPSLLQVVIQFINSQWPYNVLQFLLQNSLKKGQMRNGHKRGSLLTVRSFDVYSVPFRHRIRITLRLCWSIVG